MAQKERKGAQSLSLPATPPANFWSWETDRAILELEAGVKLAPDSPEMHYALARAYTRAGQKEKAAREREIFQRLDKLYRDQREGAGETGDSGADVKPPTKPQVM
jgi:hypothetical protein